jgi:cytochrome c-type biogenesis protein
VYNTIKGGGILFAQEVSTTMAFVAGLLSFFSPCILPLVPAYIMYISGYGDEDIEPTRKMMLTRTFFFVLGFTSIFMIMGTSASALGQYFIEYRAIFTKISGVIIIIFGFSMTGLLSIGLLKKENRMQFPVKINGRSGAYIMGIAFAAGWTPCFGPVLASILIYAGTSDTLTQGVFLLGIYSLGMAIPFMLSAMFMNGFNSLLDRLENSAKWFPRITGWILIVFGLLIVFDKLVLISNLFVN